ncbi:MAG: hypothetical protein Q9206_002795 [Seirophora lacunosa]
MVSLNWPWPPELNGLSMTDAVNATQNYVNQVEVHMVGLDLNTTECGVVIGFMLSALADATRILDFTHRQSGTSSDLRNQIEKFGAAMQSLTQYMENIGVRSDKSRSNTAPAAMDVDTVDQGDASDTFVKAEFSDSSVEAPSGAPNQNGSMDGDFAFLLTSSTYNAAILRNRNYWKPRLFGYDACVMESSTNKSVPRSTTTSPPLDPLKMRKAEQIAKRNAQLCWIEIRDRKFATTELSTMSNHQIMSLILYDLGAQDIDVQIARCKKSKAGHHIRVWTSHYSGVKVFIDQWTPTVFGTGAYVRWLKGENNTALAVSSAPMSLAQPRPAVPSPEVKCDLLSDIGEADASSDLSEQPTLTKREAREARAAMREVFVELPDQIYAKTHLCPMNSSKLKTLVRDDIQHQKVKASIARCKLFRSGKARFMLRTKTPEQAKILRTPGAWTPVHLGRGAYVVTG